MAVVSLCPKMFGRAHLEHHGGLLALAGTANLTRYAHYTAKLSNTTISW